MAQVAAHRGAFRHMNGPIAVIIPQIVPIRSGPGEGRTFQTLTMATTACARVAPVVAAVSQVPGPAVDIMHAMRSVQGQGQAGVADSAVAEGTGMALKLGGRDIVIGLRVGIRPDRVGRAVAAFAGDAAVSQAVAVERGIVFGEPLVVRGSRCGIVDLTIPGLGHAQRATQVVGGVSGVAGFATGFF